MSGYIRNTTDVHFVPRNMVAGPCPVTFFTAPTSCPPKTNGPAMCGYIVIATYIHVARKKTLVRPCSVTSLTSPTSTLSSKIQWSGHVPLHPLHNKLPPSPANKNVPAMSGNILITTYTHVVRKNTMVRPCLVTSLTPPTSTSCPQI